MANFCGKCGTGLDTATGLCPNCDREQLNAMATENVVTSTSNFCPYCGSTINQQTGMCPNPNCSNGGTDAFVASVPQDTVESKPKKNKPTALTTIITILLSICLFITSLFAIVIYDVRNAVKDDNVESLLDNIQATDLLDNTKFATNNDLDRFYNNMSSKYGIEMADHQLNNFIDRSTVKEFIADKVADFCEDFFDDDAELKITKREVVNLLQRNSSVIKDEFGVYLMDSEIQEIADWIFNEDELVIISSTTLKDSSPALYYILTIGFSYVTMAVFIILSALIIFFMIKNSLSQAACGIGIDFIIWGGLSGLVAMLAAWITPLWETICGDSFIGMIAGNFMAVNALISVILLVLGVALLVTRGLIIKHRAKKQGEVL